MVAVVDAANRRKRSVELDVRIAERDERLYVVRVERLDGAAMQLHVLVRNKSLHLEECLLLLVDAGLCPLRGSTQRRSGPVGPCSFHLSRVTTVRSSWALLRNTPSSP
jgi:hypothetical protein